MSTAQKEIEKLREARQLLVDYGWIQGDLGNTECGFCAEGALSYAFTGRADADEEREVAGWWTAWRALGDAARQIGSRGVVGFNDEPGRTREEVLAVFDKAIEELESEQ